MDIQDAKKWLWGRGCYWDPSRPVRYKSEAEMLADTTTTADVIFRDALKSAQTMHQGRMNFLTETLYSEPHQVTGKLGEATQQLMQSPMCPLPDFVPPPKIKLSYADPDLQSAVQRMQAAGTGSWPPPCQREGVTFSVDISRQPASMRQRWAAIKLDVVRDYARLGVKLVEVAHGQRANIRISWEDLDRVGQGVIGLAEFNNESCSDSVFCKMHPGYYPDDDQIRQLFEHELGHNMNLPHTSGGIMNPSITDGWIGFVASDPSVPRLKRYFPGGPIDDIPTPPKVKVAIRGQQIVELDGVEVERFISVPDVDL
jgi:hypothetical protein